MPDGKLVDLLIKELVTEFRLVLLAMLFGAHRIVKQAIDAFRIAWIQAYSDIAGQIKGILTDIDGLPDDVDEALDNPGYLFLVSQVGQQYCKLVARETRQAQSRYLVGFAHDGIQAFPEFFQ